MLYFCSFFIAVVYVPKTLRTEQLFSFLTQDMEIKEVKKGLMHHVKDVTALQKQMTAMVH